MSELITKDAVTLAYALMAYNESSEELKGVLVEELIKLEEVQLLDVEVLPYKHKLDDYTYTENHAIITVEYNNNTIALCVNIHSRTFMYRVNDRKIRFMNHVGGRLQRPLVPHEKNVQEVAELVKRVLVTEW